MASPADNAVEDARVGLDVGAVEDDRVAEARAGGDGDVMANRHIRANLVVKIRI